MLEKNYNQEKELTLRYHEIYRLHVLEGVGVSDIAKKTGLSRGSVYRALAIFESQNPQEAELMKKQSKDIRPDDYQKLVNELSCLKEELAKERLRADFYEEMVAFGKDVYGIDLKKAGTR